MDAIPAAEAEEGGRLPLYIEEFKRWMRSQGKSDVLARQTARSLISLFEEDGRSIAGMASPAYFELVRVSNKNITSHNQRSSALKHLVSFWQQRVPGPPEESVDAAGKAAKQRRGSAAPGSAASASAATPKSAGELQNGTSARNVETPAQSAGTPAQNAETPAQNAPDAKASSPGAPASPKNDKKRTVGGNSKTQSKARRRERMEAEKQRRTMKEVKKKKKEKKRKGADGKRAPPGAALRAAHGFGEVLEEAKQLAAKGRHADALCVLGRDPSSKNGSLNGVYLKREKPFHGRNSYQKEGGDRFLFFSATKGAWKVSDSFNDNKTGFAFAKVDDRGKALPSEAEQPLDWKVFGGKDDGYKKDRAVRCVSAPALLRADAPESAMEADGGESSDDEQGSESSDDEQGSAHSSDDEKGTMSSTTSSSSSGAEGKD